MYKFLYLGCMDINFPIEEYFYIWLFFTTDFEAEKYKHFLTIESVHYPIFKFAYIAQRLLNND